MFDIGGTSNNPSNLGYLILDIGGVYLLGGGFIYFGKSPRNLVKSSNLTSILYFFFRWVLQPPRILFVEKEVTLGRKRNSVKNRWPKNAWELELREDLVGPKIAEVIRVTDQYGNQCLVSSWLSRFGQLLVATIWYRRYIELYIYIIMYRILSENPYSSMAPNRLNHVASWHLRRIGLAHILQKIFMDSTGSCSTACRLDAGSTFIWCWFLKGTLVYSGVWCWVLKATSLFEANMTLLKHSAGVLLIESWARCACGSFGLTKTANAQVSISFGAPMANAVRAGSDHHVGSYQQPLGFPNYQILLPTNEAPLAGADKCIFPGSLALPPENLWGLKRKGSSSNHHFLRASC